MSNNLLDYLSQIPDIRRKQGQRYPLNKVLTLLLIGTLSGRIGYRSISRFCKDNENYLSKELDLKHGIPSHVTMTTIVEGVKFEEFESVVNKWSQSKFKNLKKSKKVTKKKIISLDGKAIKASVKNGTSNSQNFIALVNAYCTDQKFVLSSLAYENGKVGEATILRSLVKELGIKGAIFTMDAAHASKKH